MRRTHRCARQAVAFPRHDAPEFCKNIRPIKRAQGKPGVRCTRSPCARGSKHTGSHHGFTGSIRLSLHNGLTAYNALSLVTGLSCHHHRRDAKYHRQLDASVGASGPRGFAVRNSAIRPHANARADAAASIASHPNVRDDGQRPPWRDETARNKPVIWVKREDRIFFRTRLDRRVTSGKSLPACAARS
jgi:hypothetical protein